jgi:predicted NAD-dependent protein-ADP-ribosyltransferase YbiA (DUF1768 family)
LLEGVCVRYIGNTLQVNYNQLKYPIKHQGKRYPRKEKKTMNNKTIESVKQDARKLLREKGATPQLETNVLVSSIFL